MGPKRNGHDLLTELRTEQRTMQQDISYIKSKIEFLYRVDPPGPLMLLSTHLAEEKRAHWRNRGILISLSGAAGTVAVYVWHLVFGK